MSLGEILAEDNTSIKSFIFGGTFAEDGPFESNEGYLPRADYLALDERIFSNEVTANIAYFLN